MRTVHRLLLTSCLVILIFSVSAADAGYYTNNDAAEKLYTEGFHLAEKGRNQEAVDKYRQAIKLEPTFVAAYINASNCSNKLGDYQNSIAFASGALKYNSQSSYALANRALAYQHLLQYEKAVSDWNQAISNEPGVSHFYLNRGLCLQRLLRNKEADADFAKALKMPGKDDLDYLNRGSVYLEMHDFKNANSAFTLGLKKNPKLLWVLHDRGLCQVGLGHYDAAIKDYSDCLKEDPSYYHCYELRGLAEMANGNYEQSSKDLRKFLQLVNWQGVYTPYAVMVCCLADRHLKHDAAARDLLNESKNKVSMGTWPGPIIKYLAGETTAAKVLDQANNPDLMTEAKTYVGVNLAIAGKKAEAEEYLAWVKKNGNKGFSEYQIATGEFQRLSPTPIKTR